jgi:hypothetical protein
MQLKPSDIERVEEIGSLDGNKVSLLRTKGGFWIALGKKRNKNIEEALAAGSHPAIVKYNLEKQFSGFQPAMNKSEHGIEPIVSKHSHYLGEDQRKSGHDIFSIQTGNVIEFQITKQNSALATVNGNIDSDNLSINDLNIPKEFTKAMAGATLEKAIACEVGLKLLRK